MNPLNKLAGQRCQHQRVGKGCTVYHKPPMPLECRLWSCRWLSDPGATANLSRPDRAHYVIDTMPDFVSLADEDGTKTDLPAIQIWIDPAYPDTHRDPNLRNFIAAQAEITILVALVRYNSRDALTLIPPSMTESGEWFEHSGGKVEPDTPERRARMFQNAVRHPRATPG